MEMIERSPESGIYAASPDYIHALEVRHPTRLLFVSGTMGLGAEGMAAPDLEGQLELIWSNLRAILASADMTVDNIVRLTSYLRDGAFVEANQNARLRALGGRAVPTTAIIVETLRNDWLVEIEIIAAG
ncbi:enamine deaminase RidA (YjgF/YER057c/UK114 family) [Rhizobium leguminosarum]|uniref:Enamine deaminase RidA (YjgF/YER057c/UK114 family) n=1 Tax=Rhizobium leguminosarum TaxID=384 RepID=A0AAE2MF22_RHILE|nr:MULTISPECIES: RidA family protein [Rhizobium]MBB4288112.1 enamine deaminase RidA (YjgF/YER057c/UK114 family) [Rhizobium leguminosarum]MBB4295797.1 enamine deaminase RidA (YjgF/YER057c/UK114 family) [Rhizobium leguminosarum]MBB4307189.1 enamine deaminase RidA (YjgF/YER057c/UK114 family) [Rhizobium leguminosarum]MBB4417228.1 enamine deaminase RidA (YjgF/YER057c/UK114 family) [Rhizobium leguminosarum]MBB4432072.1 enamine deaminase RidA (YjgF/YER057c/UK114 family) [Rhizobium esperanzae]